MSAPNPSDLDANQCIRGAYDDATGRLRVDAEITSSIIAPPGLEVSISAVDDNIAIRNSNNANELLVNNDGSINVNVSGSGSTQDTNLIQIDGNAVSVGNGTSDNGTQRVAIASNNTPFSVNAIQSGSWTVSISPESIEIGTVDQGSPNTVANAWPIIVTDGTTAASVTVANALKVDGSAVIQPVSGTVTADAGTGNFTVVQSTGTNLHVVVDSAPTTSVTQGTSPWVSNVSQFGGNNVVTGTGTSGVGIPRVTVSSDSNILATQSGDWNVRLQDGSGTVLTSTLNGSKQSLDTNITALPNITDTTNLDVSLTGSSSASVNTNGCSTVMLEIHGTWGTGNLVIEATVDGTNYFPNLTGLDLTTFNTVGPTLDPGYTGNIQIPIAGFKSFRVRASGITGTAIVSLIASIGNNVVNGSIGNVFISGTVTANIGTTGGLALDTTVSGLQVAQDSTTAGENGTLIQGAVTTNAPSYSTGKTDPLSLDTSGLLRVSLKDTPANTNKFLVTADPITFASPQHVIIDSGTTTVTQGTSPWVVSGTVTANAGTNLNTSLLALDTSVNGILVTQGSTTSGQSGPLVQTATTTNAPTYVTAKTNPISTDTSGNIRVSLKDSPTNTNKFLVTADPITFASPQHTIVDSGTITTITNPVAVTQSTSPWVSNITQFGSNNVVTGTGTSGVGIPRVTVSNDSNILATQSGTWTVQQGTPPWSVVGNVASGASDSGNPVKIGNVFNTTLPTVTNGQRVDSQADANGRHIVLSVPSDGYKATYSATSTFVAANTATDIFTLTGSASKTIRILRIGISATQTASAEVNLILLKRSTANSGGTSTTLTNVALDSNDGAASAVSRSYTANPTTGTLIGNIRNFKLTVPVVAIGGNATAPIEQIEYFGDKNGKAIVLRGTSEVFAVNLNSVTVTGNSFSIWLEWTEE